MIFYFINEEIRQRPFNILNQYNVSHFSHYLHKLDFNSPTNDITFYIDIQDIESIPESFFTDKLQNNNIVLYREHSIDIENFSQYFINMIKKFELDYTKFYIILGHENQSTKLKKILSDKFDDINIISSMMWLFWPYTAFANSKIKLHQNVTRKFSIFSRRYVDWRRDIYFDLLIRNVLDNSHYTFSNQHPDIETDETSISEMMSNISNDMILHTPKLLSWLENVPYSINFSDPFGSEIYDLIQSSNLNIVLETHVNEQMNGVTLTEKTYKPIVCKRPFIVYGIPKILQMLRAHGFKTFDGIIDETYDTIANADMRRKAIVNEIDRINQLEDKEFDDLIKNCQSIVEHNYQCMLSYISRPIPKSFKNVNIFGTK